MTAMFRNENFQNIPQDDVPTLSISCFIDVILTKFYGDLSFPTNVLLLTVDSSGEEPPLYE